MNNSITISPVPKTDAENYALLRERGLSLLQKFSGNRWTDHNIHDPGITIMELLCYCITDAGYRTTFDIADLVTPDGAEGPDFERQFYRIHEIFPCHPITINDYRKLILDSFPGIRNVWIKPKDETEITAYTPVMYVQALQHELTLDATLARTPVTALKLKGLYQVKLELDNLQIVKNEYAFWLSYNCYTQEFFTDISDVLSNDSDLLIRLHEIYTRGVLSLLMNHRNLCEDFVDISFTETEKVTVCADIEIEPVANLQQTWFKIYEAILNYISPAIHFYSIKELLDKGKTIEEIFEGSLNAECYAGVDFSSPPDSSKMKELAAQAIIKKSFIDLNDLENFDKRKTIVASDLINLLMDIPGVITVKSLLISSYDDNGPITFLPKNNFCLHLKNHEKSFEFVLDYFLPVTERKNKIVLYKGLIPYKIPPAGIGDIMSIDYSTGQLDEQKNEELLMPSGEYRELDNYEPLQNDFPPAYLVGREGISDNAPALRKSQRLQLKGYLLFYEQLLANFFEQLNQFTNLLSWKSKEAKTYFSQHLTGIKDLDKLIDYAKVDTSTDYMESFESARLAVERKNMFLNHLLARFNEDFAQLSLLKLSYNADAASSPEISIADQNIIIGDKVDFLSDYVKISRDRSHALNYTAPVDASTFWDNDNISGLEQRAARKLGIDTVKRRKLFKPGGGYSFEKDFGVHIVEHILLRPRKNFSAIVDAMEQKVHYLNLCCCNTAEEESTTTFCDDPYSLRLTVVFPGWDDYMPAWQSYEQYIQFRKFVEQMLREEAPAHVALKICWVSLEQMEQFEFVYEDYFKQLQRVLSHNGLWGEDFDEAAFYNSMKHFVAIINELKNHYKGGYLHDCDLSETDKRPFVLNNTVLGTRGGG